MRNPRADAGGVWALLAVAAVLACGGGEGRSADEPGIPKNPLLNPSMLNERAPDVFQAKFETSKGSFVVEVRREWAPLGADRFYSLVKGGFYDGVRFFRVLDGFVAQFGIHGDPQVNAAWRAARIFDDAVKQKNARGTVTFATSGPDSRTTQVFINYRDNSRLDGMGFAPFGAVVEGMDVVDALYSGYGEGKAIAEGMALFTGEGAPRGQGPDQSRIQAEGNAYLEREFPKLDSVKRATIVTP